jgi:hypothetical protein
MARVPLAAPAAPDQRSGLPPAAPELHWVISTRTYRRTAESAMRVVVGIAVEEPRCCGINDASQVKTSCDGVFVGGVNLQPCRTAVSEQFGTFWRNQVCFRAGRRDRRGVDAVI